MQTTVGTVPAGTALAGNAPEEEVPYPWEAGIGRLVGDP